VREQLRLKGKVIWNGAGSTATTSGRLNAPFPEECAPLKESIAAGLRRGGLLEGRRPPKLSVLGGVGDGQETHVDYPPAAVAQAPVKPASAVVALEPGTRIFLGDERKLYDVPVGWACVFEGDVPHAGAGYTVQSARVHGYLEVESVRKPVDAVFDPPARQQVLPPSAAEGEAAERAAAAADSAAAAAADVAEAARELLALQAGGGAAPANGAEQGASAAPPAAQRALEQRLLEAVSRVEDGQRDAAAMAAKLAALERSLAASQQMLSLAAFKMNPHLRSRFSEYAWFATIEEFELFFATLSKFCPLEEMQYYTGPKSVHSGKLRSVSVSSTGKTRGRKHNLDYIDQFLFTMVQLAAVPDRTVLAGLFAINDSDATKYFSTWLLLLEDFLLSAMPVSSDLERRLRAKLPDDFTRDDTVWNADVAHLRIHVERAIRHTRTFAILNTRFRTSRRDLMSSIATVCTLLCNFRRPVGGTDFGLVGEDGQAVCAFTLNWGTPQATSPDLIAAFSAYLDAVNTRLEAERAAEEEADAEAATGIARGWRARVVRKSRSSLGAPPPAEAATAAPTAAATPASPAAAPAASPAPAAPAASPAAPTASPPADAPVAAPVAARDTAPTAVEDEEMADAELDAPFP